MLDSLTCADGAIGAAAQGWLVRALSLGDVARILEPVLLLLLQPKTQRTSIHCLRQDGLTGERTPGSGRLCPPGPSGRPSVRGLARRYVWGGQASTCPGSLPGPGDGSHV